MRPWKTARRLAGTLLPMLLLLLAAPATQGERPGARIAVTLLRVTDGDTVELLVAGQRERTRLIGIDAPEMGQAPWGARARGALGRLVQAARELDVELDVQQRDRYGRLLVYLFADGALVNERLLRDGHAVLLTIPPNVRYVERFTRAQQKAREAGHGIWAPDGLRERPGEFRQRRRQ